MRFIFLLSILALCACNKQEELGLLTESNLVGYWENLDNEVASTMLDFTYCSAFQLRANGEIAIYYWDSGKPENDRVDGSWSLENETELLIRLNLSTGWESRIQVISFNANEMELKEESGLTYTLIKD